MHHHDESPLRSHTCDTVTRREVLFWNEITFRLVPCPMCDDLVLCLNVCEKLNASGSKFVTGAAHFFIVISSDFPSAQWISNLYRFWSSSGVSSEIGNDEKKCVTATLRFLEMESCRPPQISQRRCCVKVIYASARHENGLQASLSGNSSERDFRWSSDR